MEKYYFLEHITFLSVIGLYRVEQLERHLTHKSEVLGLIPSLATYFLSPSADSRGEVVSYWRKYVHEVLVNRLGGLSLPRKSVVRLTDCPAMTLDVYCGCKTTQQQQQQLSVTCQIDYNDAGKVIPICCFHHRYLGSVGFHHPQS